MPSASQAGISQDITSTDSAVRVTATQEPASRGTLLIGAVAGSPAVVTIWQGMRDFFRGSAVEIDFVLYSTYARMTQALIAGHIDMAWNTNLAWVQTMRLLDGKCRALAMRDTDLAFTSIFLSRRGAGFQGLADLRGKRLAIGWANSAQAAILPLYYIRHSGLGANDVAILRPESGYAAGAPAALNLQACLGAPDSDPRGEAAAIQTMLQGQADAAVVGLRHWEQISQRQSGELPVEKFWETPGYAHCVFTSRDTLDQEMVEAWLARLYQMDWNNPEHRGLMEMEWVHRWIPPETTGYQSLFDAVEEQEVPLTW
jgi:ABC-type phosphate/phosphonate transport system substrate-binding protein